MKHKFSNGIVSVSVRSHDMHDVVQCFVSYLAAAGYSANDVIEGLSWAIGEPVDVDDDSIEITPEDFRAAFEDD